MMTSRRASILILSIWCAVWGALLLPLATGMGSGSGASEDTLPSAARLLALGRNTVGMALGTTILTLLLATPIALAAGRLMERRRTVAMLALAGAMLFIPAPVVSVAAIRLFGPAGVFTKLITGGAATFPASEQLSGDPLATTPAPIYTLPGAAFTLAWALFPLAAIAGAATMRRVPGEAEDAALLEGGAASVLARVSLPLGAGGLVAGGSLVFLLAVNEFGVPESLRSLPVLVSEVYAQFGVYYNTAPALAAGLALFGLAAFVGMLVSRVFATAGVHVFSEQADNAVDTISPTSLRRSPWAVMVRLAAWLAAAVPTLGALFGLWWTLGEGGVSRIAVWAETWATAREELGFTIVLGVATAALATAAGCMLATALARAERPTWWRLACCAPLILPGPVFGVAMQVLMRRPPGSLPLHLDDALAAFSNTHGPLLLAWTIRFAPLVTLIVERSLRMIPADHWETARLEGAGAWSMWWSVAWPATWPAVAAGALAAFAFSLGEVGAAILLLPPGPTTLGVRLMTLMHYAPTGEVSGLCLMMALPALVAYIAALGVTARERM